VGYYPLTLWIHILIVSPIKMALFVALFRWKNSVGIYRGIKDWWRGKYGWIR
jgi:hypothetical protein